MSDLLTRTVSQGLQAFLPIAFAWVWLRRAGAADALVGLKWGAVAAIPATVGATSLFQLTNRQALWEAVLAAGALLLAIWFARVLWRAMPPPEPGSERSGAYRLAF